MLWREPRRVTSPGEISETGFGERLWRGQEERFVERMVWETVGVEREEIEGEKEWRFLGCEGRGLEGLR